MSPDVYRPANSKGGDYKFRAWLSRSLLPNTPLRLLRNCTYTTPPLMYKYTAGCIVTAYHKVLECTRPRTPLHPFTWSLEQPEQPNSQTPSRRERLVVHSPSFDLTATKTLKRPRPIPLSLQPPEPILSLLISSFAQHRTFGNTLGPNNLGPQESS